MVSVATTPAATGHDETLVQSSMLPGGKHMFQFASHETNDLDSAIVQRNTHWPGNCSADECLYRKIPQFSGAMKRPG